ncbi:radical SAM protein [Chloroflexota bacterium]
MQPEPNALDEFYFQWHITERCNKHCRHCYQNGHPSKELPLDDLAVILERMDEALQKWDRIGSLSLTGGEPFLRRLELLELMDRVDHLDSFAYYDILTNGSLISTDVAQELKAHSKLRRIQVSLEGSTPAINDAIRGGGSYDQTLQANGPHYKARDVWARPITDEDQIIAGVQWKLSRSTGGIYRAAPPLGRDRDYVFCELLGMTRTETAALDQQGIFY